MAADHRAAATAALPETLLRQQATLKTKTPEATEMTTPSTEHPILNHAPEDQQPKDDRSPGVHLLEHDGECKTTAELSSHGDYWKVREWELIDGEEGLGWAESSMYSIGADRVEMLARLQAMHLAQPPAEQGALNLDPQA